jgi:hypothetical protein
MIMILEKERVAYSYKEFVQLTEKLLAEGKTTGENHSEAYLHYTQMNLRRMNRIYKSTTLSMQLTAAIRKIKRRFTWLVLVEAWCGDVAQNLPVIARIAELNPNIDLVLILRDENLDVIDSHLTDGGRGIPKLIVIDEHNGEEVATWGPRPAPAQKMVVDYKNMAEKPPYSEFVEKIQKWYADNKTIVLQHEFLTLINDLIED